MPISGDLSTMSLADLLQWASLTQKTGVLEVERNKICRRIEFRKGWVGACSTDDPPSRLGQFLLSRGKITREVLREAMARHERSGDNLALILMQMGQLTQAELARLVAARAEETIQGLFDWEDAVFRFHEGATLEPNQIEINLSAQDLMLQGLKHQAELTEIRKAFPSSGVVLRRTGRSAPSPILDRAIARRIYDTIDGERTIAEVLLHAHASAFLVIKLLYRLFQLELVVVEREQPPETEFPTMLDVPRRRDAASTGGWDVFDLADLGDGPLPASTTGRDIEAANAPPASSDAETARANADLDAEVAVATRLFDREEYAAALELLNASYRANRGEEYLRRLIFKTESAFVAAVRIHPLSPDNVPRVQPSAGHRPNGTRSPEEAYLLSLIDGSHDVKSILWLAPLREVDVLRALHRMLDRGLIGMGEAQVRDAAVPAGEADRTGD